MSMPQWNTLAGEGLLTARCCTVTRVHDLLFLDAGAYFDGAAPSQVVQCLGLHVREVATKLLFDGLVDFCGGGSHLVGRIHGEDTYSLHSVVVVVR